MNKDSVFKTISLFALPMLIGNILQQMYNIVDTWIVGRYISSDALAAVGSVFSLMVFISSILLGLCMGSGVVFSYAFAQKEYEVLERRLGTSFCRIGIVMVVITAVSLILTNQILHWIHIPENLFHMTREYLVIIIFGIPAVFLYNFFAAYLKSVGNSVLPLLWLAISTVCNVVLDLYFIIGLQMGIKGAAYATIIAQYVSGIGCVMSCLVRDRHIRAMWKKITIQIEDVKILVRYSLYTCIQQSVMNLGILMVQGIVNTFGASVMAAFATGGKIDAFAYMPAQEYGNAASIFLAQNYASGDNKRVREGIGISILTSGIYCLSASAVIWIFAEDLMRIFVDASNTEIIQTGVEYLHIEGAFYIGIGFLFLLYGFCRALGNPEMSLVLTILSLGTRVVLAKISASGALGKITLGRWLGLTGSGAVRGIWMAVPVGWFLADVVGFLWMQHKKYQIK